MEQTGWDVIGDIHGRLGALDALLRRLGYRERGGAWRHPGRKALFIGDMVDRGSEVGSVLRLVRAMTDAGTACAILGNHEYNVLGHLHDLEHGTSRCRMNPQKISEMRPSLAAIAADPSFRRWLIDLPLFAEADGIRFVHAYWGERELETLSGRRTLPECDWNTSAFDGSKEETAIKRLLKGPELGFPDGIAILSKRGYPQRETRVAWWKPRPEEIRIDDILVKPGEFPAGVLPCARTWGSYEPYPADSPPVFIGHYGYDAFPGLLAANIACVDYGRNSEGTGIGAYRTDIGAPLSTDGFII